VTLPLIVGLQGPALTNGERAFLSVARPLGIILFARNIVDPDQVAALTAACRETLDEDPWILIDQEGGRVARLKPPHWAEYPAAGRLGALPSGMAEDCVYANARLIADALYPLGITVDCHPVLDLALPDTHAIIGDRAFSRDPETVGRLGRAACQGLLDGGILPVIKHIPGHGRATADSHETLPFVAASRAELEADFAAFRAAADAPVAMTAHIVYEALDPAEPATMSCKVIETVIRGEIGFEGVLLSDDLTMRALTGPMGERATRALAAGCDAVLHCNGVLAEMEEIAAMLSPLSGESGKRVAAVRNGLRQPRPFDVSAAKARLDKNVAAGGQETIS